MPITSQHVEYTECTSSWTLMRDVLKGPPAIKKKRTDYLPCPSGMIQYTVDVSGVKRITAGPAYEAYLKRARFPDITSPTLRGLLGCFDRKPHQFEVPSRLNYILESATADGISLDALVSRIMREVLTTGRCPILVDVPMSSGNPYIVQYYAEDLINWRTLVMQGRELLSMATLCGIQSRASSDDIYQSDTVTIYRGLVIDDGKYVQQIYELENGDLRLIDEIIPQQMGGSTLDYIPLTIIGSIDTNPDIDIIPLYGIAEIAVSIYQQYADYRQALYMTSQPTAVVTGISHDQTPDMIGASSVWTLEPADAKAYFLEFSGNGVSAQRVAIQDELAEASSIGAQMLEASKRSAESGEALRLRQGAVTATLSSAVTAVEAGITTALKQAAEWIGADPDQVRVTLNRDFLEEDMDPQKLQALVASWQAQAISQEVLFQNLRKMEVVPAGMSDEELRAQIEVEGPMLSSAPESPPEEENNEDDEDEDEEDDDDEME